MINLFLYLVMGNAVLLLYCLFALLGVLLLVKTVQYLFKRYSCFHCNGSGKLHGFDPHLNHHFDEESCYVCNGKRIVTHPLKMRWANIARQNLKRIKQINILYVQLQKNKDQFSQNTIITPSTRHQVFELYSDVLQQFQQQAKTLKEEELAHQASLRFALTNLHNLNLCFQSKAAFQKLSLFDEQYFHSLNQQLAGWDDSQRLYVSEYLSHIDTFEKNDFSLLSAQLQLEIEQAQLAFNELIP